MEADERAAAEQREMLDIQKLIKMGFEEGDVIMAYYQARFSKFLRHTVGCRLSGPTFDRNVEDRN